MSDSATIQGKISACQAMHCQGLSTDCITCTGCPPDSDGDGDPDYLDPDDDNDGTPDDEDDTPTGGSGGSGSGGGSGDGGGGVGADARQHLQLRYARGEFSPELAGDDRGAFVQVAGAAVVAKASPGGEDVVERRGGQRLDCRPAREELEVVGNDGFHRRLLQHDLGDPDLVGIR